EYIVEPYEDPANKNTPPKLKFEPNGQIFTGPPNGIAASYTATVAVPLTLTTWVTDEGPKINVPEPTPPGRGRGRGANAAANPFAVPPLVLAWSMFRGPGAVKFDNARPSIE